MQERPELHGISPVQQVYVDAVKAPLDMIEVAFERLQDRLSRDVEDERSKAEMQSDAWTIVDNAYRLNTLLRQFPGLKQRGEVVRAALAVFKNAEPFRHAVQHMNNEIRSTAAEGRDVWGELYWCAKEPDGSEKSHLRIRAPYSDLDRKWTVPGAPQDLDYSAGVAFIHMLLADKTINLSQVAEAASKFSSCFLDELSSAYGGRSGEPGETLRLFVPANPSSGPLLESAT